MCFIPTWRGADTPQVQPTPRILIVEDSSSARRILQELLFRLGATPQNLRLVADANEALRVAAEWHPELVLLDMELRPTDSRNGSPQPPAAVPEVLNGEDLGHHLIRADPHVPIVVVTALDPEHPRVRELRQKGAVDVIVKPVRAAKVQEVFDRLGVRFTGDSWMSNRRNHESPQDRGTRFG